MPATIDDVAIQHDRSTAEALQYRRWLSDKILVAFHHACDEKDVPIAGQLLATLECLISRPFVDPRKDRRKTIESLVGAHNRLWHLKQAGKKDAGEPLSLREG